MTTTGEPGTARSPGITYQQLLDADTHPVPDVLRLEHPQYLGSDDIDVGRYTSRAWHEEEVEHLWRRVWQYACRTDEIPEVGDYIRLRDRARLLHRGPHRGRRASRPIVNACLHRGRKLKDYDGRCS